LNYVGNDTKHGPILMSVLLDSGEPSSSVPKQLPTSSSSSPTQPQVRPKEKYKVILRFKNRTVDKTISSSQFTSDCPGPREIMKVMKQISRIFFSPQAFIDQF